MLNIKNVFLAKERLLMVLNRLTYCFDFSDPLLFNCKGFMKRQYYEQHKSGEPVGSMIG